jgi:hypothetical protein
MQMIVLRSDSAITFVSPWARRHVQIVLRRYRSVAEVIAGFDIDACSLAFDGARVLALPRSQRALNCAYNLVDPSRRSPTYEMRLYKYAMRGFSVLVPAFDAKVQGLARLLLYSQHAKTRKQIFPQWFVDTSKTLKDLEMPKCDYGPRSELEYLPFHPRVRMPTPGKSEGWHGLPQGTRMTETSPHGPGTNQPTSKAAVTSVTCQLRDSGLALGRIDRYLEPKSQQGETKCSARNISTFGDGILSR